MNHRMAAIFFTTAVVAQACSTATPPSQPSTPQQPSSAQSTASTETRSIQDGKTPSKAAQGSMNQADPTYKSNNEKPAMTARTADPGAKQRPGLGIPTEMQHGQKQMPISPGSPPRMPVGQTDEERRAQLERQLDASLADFDGRLLQERRESSSETAAGGESNAAGGIAAGVSDGSGQGASESSASVENTSGRGATPDDQIATAPENNQGPLPPGAPPADIPSGHDDDIVARQLREAAENETDPVLKEKLWQEYRDYKNATAARTGSGASQ